MESGKVIAKTKGKTLYKSGENCIKVFEEGYSKADILNEALNLARIEETGLNTPKVKEVKMVDNKWAIIMDYIEGKTLEQLIKENPSKTQEYLELFVDIQMQMHAKRCPLLNKWKDKMNRKISASGIDATVRYDLHMRVESMPKHNKLCHGDFNPSNIIIGNDGKNYIIDWAHATQGNASADTARTYLYLSLYYSKEVANSYMDLFCKKSDTAKQYVQKWLPIVAASQTVKNNENEKEFLLKWVNVVDYE